MLKNQTCKVCGHRDKFDFYVPDYIWRAVVPKDFQNRVVCLSCFDSFAAEGGVPFAGTLSSLYFVGDRVTCEFQVKWSIENDQISGSSDHAF